MTSDSLKIQIPAGIRDLLPDEALRKRTLEHAFEKTFISWGYREIVTPTFEYYASLSMGRGAEEESRLYKFIDRQGHILALRPDMTTPIARLVGTRLKDEKLPLRLFYMGNAFSFEDPQAGRQREFYQSGIELMGDDSAFADAEVIAVAVEIVRASGLKSFKVSIGHVDVLYGIIEELGLPEEEKGRVKNAVSNKNYVGLQELLDEFKVPASNRDKFMQVITCHGGKEILGKVAGLTENGKVTKALKDLEQVYDALEAYGITDYVEIDLGVLRGLDYYTGVVFEGYSAHLGFPILGGGRYDNLMGQFGRECPATGFALGMERLLLSLENEGGQDEADTDPDFLIIYTAAQAPTAFKKARELRGAGNVVVTHRINGGPDSGLPVNARATLIISEENEN
ncbi:MAG TPA: ATP phosphoribosyltransferase regulatory subunit [Desulfobacteria bacterium]|nr:ATP phosphoribosyltransferase regulatory subunit [Desulfobacteria bacterium]